MGTSGTDRVTNAFRLVNKRMKNKPKCRLRVIANVISGLVYETPSVATWFPSPPPRRCPRLPFVLRDWIHLVFLLEVTLRLEGLQRGGDKRETSLFCLPPLFPAHMTIKKKTNIISHLPSLLSSLLISTCPDLLLFL